MGNASACCSQPTAQTKNQLIALEKQTINNEDCDVREQEADDFVRIGLQANNVKEHTLFNQSSIIKRMASVEAPKLGQRLEFFPEVSNQIVRTVISQLQLKFNHYKRYVNHLYHYFKFQMVLKEENKILQLNLTMILSTLENGRILKSMVMENYYGQMEVIMKVVLLITKHLDMVDWFTHLEITMKVSGRMIKQMVLVNIVKQIYIINFLHFIIQLVAVFIF